MRIKINTKNITRKLSAISYKLSAFRKLTANSYKLKAIPKANSYKLTATKKGFTLVELLVTLSLFVVLTTIVLFSQQKFNGSILLTNLAYDVALTIRQAQTYGVNVREDVKNNTFQNPYGVHFDTQNNNNKKFLLFSDSSGAGKYNGNWDCSGNGGDECLNKYSIKRGNYISDIKVTSPDCAPDPSPCSVKDLDITFLRPDPDAIFYKTTKSGGGGNVDNITDATIIISSANGDNRNVLVNSTGQISIGRGSGISCSTTITNPMTYNYLGSEQCYQVPNGVTSITIEACGAKGTNGQSGMASGGSGGQGGKAQGTFSIAGGNVLSVYVGGSGGYNGGGSVGAYGGKGGGASDVRLGSSKIIVAGGGGGGGGADGNRTGGNGGNGGGYIGSDGYGGVAEFGGTSYGGAGGTQTSGGGGNQAGSSGLGGNALTERSGGGGGGYFGGGAGNRTGTSAGGGGGGGSSYIDSSAISGVSTQPGVCSGNGYVNISY